MGTTRTQRCALLVTLAWLVTSSVACSAGSGGSGKTSVAVNADAVQTVPQAPISLDPNAPADLPTDSDLPIVPTPQLPGNVPYGTIWMNPSPEIAFDVTGPLATEVFYNQLGSLSVINDLAAIVQTNPNFITDHITLIGRSLSNRRVYNVTLYDTATGAPIEVPVDDLLLATTQRVLLDGVPISRDKLSKVIWPALYIKAMASYLGGYAASFTDGMRIMTGQPYGAVTNVYHAQSNVIDPILNQVNANTPVVMTSLSVSEGETVTGVSPDDPNVSLLQAGYTFGCVQTQGLQRVIQLCLQVNTAHYIIAYANGDVTLRATAPRNAGAQYDGKYGYMLDGSTIMPLQAFIELTNQIKPLSTALPAL